MTLQTFRNLTAATPEPALRRAMLLALAVERPVTPQDYGRFYVRVVEQLCPSYETNGTTNTDTRDAAA